MALGLRSAAFKERVAELATHIEPIDWFVEAHSAIVDSAAMPAGLLSQQDNDSTEALFSSQVALVTALRNEAKHSVTVSYTHLTLPTKRIV